LKENEREFLVLNHEIRDLKDLLEIQKKNNRAGSQKLVHYVPGELKAARIEIENQKGKISSLSLNNLEAKQKIDTLTIEIGKYINMQQTYEDFNDLKSEYESYKSKINRQNYSIDHLKEVHLNQMEELKNQHMREIE